jgi:TolB-like protein/DNA-binding SARP family transcriptional activator/Tfp pilus assembly protein PilF
MTTLGSIGLEGPDRAACERVLSQPKQFALLAYLSARPEGERVSRDRILAMFWPESTTTRARGSLRTALHRLRRELGERLIEGSGEQVWIESGGLRCDAARLLADAGDASAESLLGLYRGEFLDGLHVTGAPDFERWVDRTRAALRTRVTELAWVLSGRAEVSGEWITAARFARRAAELAVDVEGATQRLIRLLDRAGDRAAAVAAYDGLARALEREYGLAPSPETVALVASVRGRIAVGGSVPAPAGVEASRGARSLAVLPFDDLSGGGGTYLAQGLGEDLLTALSRMRGVRVISRTSVRRFAASPPASVRAVREALGADVVVEGSVQVSGDRCRITVQLIDALRDEHLWAETYDRALADVFEVQSDVALRIARALEAELSPREHARLRHPPATSPRAWQMYLKGRALWSRRNARDTQRAAALFERALELDDRFAPAWAGLADARLMRALLGDVPLAEVRRGAREAIDRTLAIDPESGEARATLGIILEFFERDRPGAGREYRRAIELSPGHASAHCWYGNWLCVERRSEGIAELETAMALDPLSPVVRDSHALALLHVGGLDEAVASSRHTLEMDPGFWRARFTLGVGLALRGELHEAVAELVHGWSDGGWGADPGAADEASRLLGRDARAALEHLLASARSTAGEGTLRMVEVVLLMLLDRRDDAIAALEAARDAPWSGFLVLYAPILDPLAGRPRFRRAMEAIELMLPRWTAPA